MIRNSFAKIGNIFESSKKKQRFLLVMPSKGGGDVLYIMSSN